MAAVFSGAEGGEGDAVRAAAGGAAAGVADDSVRGVDRVLVRAPRPDGGPGAVQESPAVGARIQTPHLQQVRATYLLLNFAAAPAAAVVSYCVSLFCCCSCVI